MKLFPTGITITELERSFLPDDAEGWLMGLLDDKTLRRRDALIREWAEALEHSSERVPTLTRTRAKFITNQTTPISWTRQVGGRTRSVTKGPYQTRLEQDAVNSVPLNLHQTARFNAIDRDGPTVTLLPDGIGISDEDAGCLLAYLQDISDWILGALLGQITKGETYAPR